MKASLIWWPNLKEDLENLKKACPECRTHQPSLPKERAKGMINPRHPFQSLHADYFHLAGKIFLVTVDPYTSWPIVFRCSKGGTALELTGFLREVFSNYGVPSTAQRSGQINEKNPKRGNGRRRKAERRQGSKSNLGIQKHTDKRDRTISLNDAVRKENEGHVPDQRHYR